MKKQKLWFSKVEYIAVPIKYQGDTNERVKNVRNYKTSVEIIKVFDRHIGRLMFATRNMLLERER
jgi:hypothetical protein